MTRKDKSRGALNRSRPVRRVIQLAMMALLVAGCGGGGSESSGTPPPTIAAPVILTAPTGQSVPMGLGATFSVVASGAELTYQWKVNGSVIPGATTNSYQTSPTGFSDSGSTYTVTVSNSGGTIDTTPVSLTVTARAPNGSDLRFQLVDAPTTVNGWGNAGVGLSTNLVSRGAMYFSPSIGSPFAVGSNGSCASPATLDGVACDWFFTEAPQATGTGTSLTMAYGSDVYDDFPADLQSLNWPGFSNGVTAASPRSVITSADIEPEDDLFAVSWIQANTQSAVAPGFDLQVSTVTPANLQAAATQEGLNSRVITAICANGTQVTYFSYGWAGDTTTLYDSQIVNATPGDAPTAAANLAAAGYIITATGSAGSTGNVYLVGTRVQGDSVPRPFATSASQPTANLMQQGYALVGAIFNLQGGGTTTFLGER